MGLFRGLNLLQGVEAQTTLGAALESILSASPAQTAELGAMLSTRHMARRMAGNTITMAAINSSATAIQTVFEKTSTYNFRPIEEVTKSATAMLSTSQALSSLTTVIDNAVAWSYYSSSAYYEDNIVNTLTTIIGRNPSNYANISALILDGAAMGEISINARAMKALVSSSPAMTVVTSNSAPMIDIAANTDAITITANSSIAMSLISQSQIALDEVTNEARAIVVNVPSAVGILASYEAAWDFIMSTSTTLATNIYKLLVIFAEVNSTTHTSVTNIFNDSIASGKVSNSRAAMISVLYEPTTLSTMIASPNLEAILTSTVATNQIAGNTGALNSFIADGDAWDLFLAGPLLAVNLKTVLSTLAGVTAGDFANVNALIDNAPALTAIAGSTAAVQALASDSAAMTYLSASSNVGIILDSSTAMAVLGPDVSVMSSFLDNVAIGTMFASSVVKGFLMASDALIDKLVGTPSILTYMEGIGVQSLPTAFSNGVYATFQDYDNAPSKVIVLGGRGNNIGAIFHNYKFQGSVSSKGTGATDAIALAGTPAANPQNQDFYGAYTGLQWTTSDAAKTAASYPSLLLVDMS
jgi:hypothetical protein